MKFGDALDALEAGQSVKRSGWNGKDQHVYMQHFTGGPYEGMEPCFVLRNSQGLNQPGWVPSMGDLRAKDWELA